MQNRVSLSAWNIPSKELLNLDTLQARASFSFGGFIPDNTPVDGVLFPPMPVSTSTSLNGQLVQFTGPGALPFTLTLASPATLEQGTTVTGVISSASANGTITLDYTYTPSPVTAPTPVTAAEPASLALLGAGLVGLGLANRHHPARRRRAQMISFCRKLRSTVIALQAVAVLILRRELTTLATLWVSSQLGMSNPYVKRGKNDRNDADAICEAAGRSGMHFGPAKSVMHAAR